MNSPVLRSLRSRDIAMVQIRSSCERKYVHAEENFVRMLDQAAYRLSRRFSAGRGNPGRGDIIQNLPEHSPRCHQVHNICIKG